MHPYPPYGGQGAVSWTSPKSNSVVQKPRIVAINKVIVAIVQA
jgi:hypothetical protein